jgi:hypothetical protein
MLPPAIVITAMLPPAIVITAMLPPAIVITAMPPPATVITAMLPPAIVITDICNAASCHSDYCNKKKCIEGAAVLPVTLPPHTKCDFHSYFPHNLTHSQQSSQILSGFLQTYCDDHPTRWVF